MQGILYVFPEIKKGGNTAQFMLCGGCEISFVVKAAASGLLTVPPLISQSKKDSV